MRVTLGHVWASFGPYRRRAYRCGLVIIDESVDDHVDDYVGESVDEREGSEGVEPPSEDASPSNISELASHV